MSMSATLSVLELLSHCEKTSFEESTERESCVELLDIVRKSRNVFTSRMQ